MTGFFKTAVSGLALAGVAAFCAGGMPGCGQIIDKDRIRIAKVGDKFITRGDLFKLIREMADTERPKIQSKGDLLRILNQHIDAGIKIPLGKKLKDEGKIDIPRDAAREQYFRESGDEGDHLRAMWAMQVPANGESTPLMRQYDLTAERLQFQKDLIDEDTDRTLERMLGDKAVEYLAATAYKEGKITVSDEELAREYRMAGETMKTLEEMTFLAVRFPAALPDAPARAAEVRRRLDQGESFDALVDEHLLKGKAENRSYVIESGIANNPALERFKGFWDTASGSGPGTIIGPVYLPAYQQVAQDSQGRTRSVNMPDAYLVLRVSTHKPEKTLTMEEAKPLLAAPLLVGKMMEQLRGENGVEIYEDKLPEVSQMGMGGPGI